MGGEAETKCRGGAKTSFLQPSPQVTEAWNPDTLQSRAPPQGPGGSMECGHAVTPVGIKYSA